MTATGPIDPAELVHVSADDAVVDALAAGRRVSVEHGDEDSATVVGLLARWRAELDERTALSMTTTLPVGPSTARGRPRRWMGTHRRTAAATAVVIALTTSTGVAAAASGRSGPLGGLHQLLFGSEPTHRLDGAAAEANGLLDAVAARMRSAKESETMSARARDRLAGELANAKRLLDRDPLAPTALVNRLDDLTAALAAIRVTTTAPTPPATGDTRHGDVGDHGGGDRSGPDTSGRGDGDDGREGSGGDRRGGPGPDDGSGGGSDDGSAQSGDDGGGGTSGSGDTRGDDRSGDGG